MPTSGSLDLISRDGDVAQLDPLRLCQFLLDECQKQGVTVHQPAKAVTVVKNADGILSGVTILKDAIESESMYEPSITRFVSRSKTDISVPCTRLVICAGAWSPRVFSELFPSAPIKIPVTALAGHSLLLRSSRWTKEHQSNGCHAVFATDMEGFAPEIFSRREEQIYIAGLNSTTMPLPELASDATPIPECIESLKRASTQMLGKLEQPDSLQVVRESLCFRPVTATGRPIISRISNRHLGDKLTEENARSGVFLASGHGAWGISQSLGSGLVLSEIMDGKATSANIVALGLR
ncbi:FAD dependent oxidoreductase [Microthyrium microscopicum]|uniref:FAD dependent oxidoreductase n=1 Tax=Microthyrium microscopicum TaxID=703497 RepID=A0A6A6U1L1_9PEZI|nr:FAD dependent oxidoreductase [Microthyrium microscopicum]